MIDWYNVKKKPVPKGENMLLVYYWTACQGEGVAVAHHTSGDRYLVNGFIVKRDAFTHWAHVNAPEG